MKHIKEMNIYRDGKIRKCAECKAGDPRAYTQEAEWYITGYDYEEQRPVRQYVCDMHLVGIKQYSEIEIKKQEKAMWLEQELDELTRKHTGYENVRQLAKAYPTLRTESWQTEEARAEIKLLRQATIEFGNGYAK